MGSKSWRSSPALHMLCVDLALEWYWPSSSIRHSGSRVTLTSVIFSLSPSQHTTVERQLNPIPISLIIYSQAQIQHNPIPPLAHFKLPWILESYLQPQTNTTCLPPQLRFPEPSVFLCGLARGWRGYRFYEVEGCEHADQSEDCVDMMGETLCAGWQTGGRVRNSELCICVVETRVFKQTGLIKLSCIWLKLQEMV